MPSTSWCLLSGEIPGWQIDRLMEARTGMALAYEPIDGSVNRWTMEQDARSLDPGLITCPHVHHVMLQLSSSSRCQRPQ
jgi:hypothetical protein